MKDEEFKSKLSEVADWQLKDFSAETSPSGRTYKKRKVGKINVNEDDLSSTDEEDLDLDANADSAPVELLRVKVQACTCEDCGRYCEGGRKTEAKKHTGNNKNHWRERCLTCNLYFNPFTDKFDLKQNMVASTWVNWLRDGRRIKPFNSTEFFKKLTK